MYPLISVFLNVVYVQENIKVVCFRMLIVFIENVEIIHNDEVFMSKLNLVTPYLDYWLLLNESSSRYEFTAEPFWGEASCCGGLRLRASAMAPVVKELNFKF